MISEQIWAALCSLIRKFSDGGPLQSQQRYGSCSRVLANPDIEMESTDMESTKLTTSRASWLSRSLMEKTKERQTFRNRVRENRKLAKALQVLASFGAILESSKASSWIASLFFRDFKHLVRMHVFVSKGLLIWHLYVLRRCDPRITIFVQLYWSICKSETNTVVALK